MHAAKTSNHKGTWQQMLQGIIIHGSIEEETSNCKIEHQLSQADNILWRMNHYHKYTQREKT
jgi:hypothetical protein